MEHALSQISAWILALTLAWAAGAKALAPARWRSAVARYGFSGPAGKLIAVALPIVEIAVAGLLVFGLRKPGAALAIALLGAFSLSVLNARAAHGDRLPCGCFGGTEDRDYRWMLVRNAALGCLAAIVLVGGQVPVLQDLVPLRSEQVFPALLVGVSAILIGWTLRQVTVSSRDRHQL